MSVVATVLAYPYETSMSTAAAPYETLMLAHASPYEIPMLVLASLHESSQHVAPAPCASWRCIGQTVALSENICVFHIPLKFVEDGYQDTTIRCLVN